MKKAVAALIVVAMGIVGLGAADLTYAVTCPKGSAKAGNSVGSLAECNMDNSGAGSTSLMPTLTTIINVVLGVLGILTVAVIIIGGFMYVTSTGDAGKVTKAKSTIMYGIIGLVIALLAWAIVNFVLSSLFVNKGGDIIENTTKSKCNTGQGYEFDPTNKVCYKCDEGKSYKKGKAKCE